MIGGHFIVERPSEDGLSKEEWEFTIIDLMVVVDAYRQMTRKTRRHKFQTDKVYSRLTGGRSSYREMLLEEDVPTPPDVFEEALEKVRSMVKVGLWKRDFKKG